MTTCKCGQASHNLSDEQKTSANFWATTTFLEKLVAARSQLTTIDWDRLVATYSSLKFTSSTDRLIAISGLASTLYNIRRKPHEVVESEAIPIYIAGLWRMWLVKDMAWLVGPTLIFARGDDAKAEAVATERVWKSRPTTYVAPLWSWISILDPIRYFLWCEMDSLFSFLGARINLVTDNTFGSVQEGCHLHLRGSILKSSWKLTTDIHNMSVYPLKDVIGAQLLGKTDQIGIKFSSDYANAKPGPNQLDSRSMLYVLLLTWTGLRYTRTFGDIDPAIIDQSQSTLCLVLKAVGGNTGEIHVYERVGFTEYTYYQDGVRKTDPKIYLEEDLYIILSRSQTKEQSSR
jgi:hypothetical protein